MTSSNHNDCKNKNIENSTSTTTTALGKSLEHMMERHRRMLVQSAAMVDLLQREQQQEQENQQKQQQQQRRPSLHQYHRRHHQTLAAALAAFQSHPFQHQRAAFPFPRLQAQSTGAATAATMAAPTELAENTESIRLTMDLPGVYKKDLKVHVDRVRGNVLTVQAVRRTFSVSGQVCIKKQRIARSFAIDTTVVNLAQVVVTLDNGVLTITAPKWKTTTVKTPQLQPQQGETAASTVPDDHDVTAKVSLDSVEDIEQSSSSSFARK
jgi:HSP20 family molecular chaperone IbpA